MRRLAGRSAFAALVVGEQLGVERFGARVGGARRFVRIGQRRRGIAAAAAVFGGLVVSVEADAAGNARERGQRRAGSVGIAGKLIDGSRRLVGGELGSDLGAEVEVRFERRFERSDGRVDRVAVAERRGVGGGLGGRVAVRAGERVRRAGRRVVIGGVERAGWAGRRVAIRGMRCARRAGRGVAIGGVEHAGWAGRRVAIEGWGGG